MMTVVVLTATVGYAQPGAKKTEKKEKKRRKDYPACRTATRTLPRGDSGIRQKIKKGKTDSSNFL